MAGAAADAGDGLGTELLGADREVLAVAAIARAVDARLLGAVLPGVDGDHAEAWLRAADCSEPLGTRVTLRRPVAEALRRRLRDQEPAHERGLRRRVLEHVYARALRGETLFDDVVALIDEPALRRTAAAGGLATARELVYRDLQMAAPPVRVGVDDAHDGTVREALRSFHDPLALAASPLAGSGTVSERVAEVRTLLQVAVADAFADTADDRLLRTAVRRGYLDPDGGHAQAPAELGLSRTTYFRRLAEAVVRVSDQIVTTRSPSRTP